MMTVCESATFYKSYKPYYKAFFSFFSQIGLFDLEVNCLTKILFGALVVVSLVMVALQHFAGRWYLQIIRFLLLFSNIIPIRYAHISPL